MADGLTVVLVPVRGGNLLVCDLEQLEMRLGDPDYDVKEAIESAMIDEIEVPRTDVAIKHIERVVTLNDTGDSGAYWA